MKYIASSEQLQNDANNLSLVSTYDINLIFYEKSKCKKIK